MKMKMFFFGSYDVLLLQQLNDLKHAAQSKHFQEGLVSGNQNEE